MIFTERAVLKTNDLFGTVASSGVMPDTEIGRRRQNEVLVHQVT
jgi:hypothetical protein